MVPRPGAIRGALPRSLFVFLQIAAKEISPVPLLGQDRSTTTASTTIRAAEASMPGTGRA
jgi:hypothetical protein